MIKKTILWISRHEMTDEQFSDLNRIFGCPIVLNQWRDTVRNIHDLSGSIKYADAVAAVLPIDLFPELIKLADGIPVLRAVSDRKKTGRVITLADGRKEEEFAYVHRAWEQVLRVEVETKRL